MKRNASRFMLTALLLALATAAQAAGYAVWEMGTKSSAMGGVLTASADDPTAIFFNPAGMARLDGCQATLDLTVINPYTEFSGVGPNPGFGVTERLDDPIFFLPQVFFTHQVNSEWAFGFGFYTPYGLAVEWANAESFSGRNVATKTDLKTFFLSPTVAFNPTDEVSVGFGLNLVKAKVELNQNLFENLPDYTEVGKAELTGDSDWAMSFNAGLMMDVGEATTLGFSYKSQTDLSFSGDANFIALADIYETGLPVDGPMETELPLPSLFSVGIASQVSEKLMLEFNLNRIQWSAFESLELKFANSPEKNKTLREDYVNTTQYRFGAEYQYSPILALRGGFVLDESPQPDGSMGPVLPDADRIGVSIGAGYEMGDMTLDIYNLFLFMEDRQIRTNWDNFNGDYSTYTNLIGFGLTYRF